MSGRPGAVHAAPAALSAADDNLWRAGVFVLPLPVNSLILNRPPAAAPAVSGRRNRIRAQTVFQGRHFPEKTGLRIQEKGVPQNKRPGRNRSGRQHGDALLKYYAAPRLASRTWTKNSS